MVTQLIPSANRSSSSAEYPFESESLDLFQSMEPLGYAGNDTNLFRYVGNGPTNWTDATGLQKDKAQDVADDILRQGDAVLEMLDKKIAELEAEQAAKRATGRPIEEIRRELLDLLETQIAYLPKSIPSHYPDVIREHYRQICATESRSQLEEALKQARAQVAALRRAEVEREADKMLTPTRPRNEGPFRNLPLPDVYVPFEETLQFEKVIDKDLWNRAKEKAFGPPGTGPTVPFGRPGSVGTTGDLQRNKAEQEAFRGRERERQKARDRALLIEYLKMKHELESKNSC